MDMPIFKARPSRLADIMTQLKGGITEKQAETLAKYRKRAEDHANEVKGAKPLTDAMQAEFAELVAKEKEPPRLSDTTISYLKDWYATTMYGDYSEEQTKYTAKGLIREIDAISVVGEMNNNIFMIKNEVLYKNEWLEGTPDIVDDKIYDTKCSWNSKTFLESVMTDLSSTYWWQMQGYMWLTGLTEARVCFVLLDTPEEIYGDYKSYEDIDIKRRYCEKAVEWIPSTPSSVQARVQMCREWLASYHMAVSLKLGGLK